MVTNFKCLPRNAAQSFLYLQALSSLNQEHHFLVPVRKGYPVLEARAALWQLLTITYMSTGLNQILQPF